MPSGHSKRGITLVEAVAGTALLGSLLVAVLIASSRLQVQRARSEARLAACGVADGLLEGWWEERDEFPRRAEGPVPGRDGWRWRTEVVENGAAADLGGEVVALEVFAPGGSPGPAEGGQPLEPAVRVELVLPEAEDASKAGPDAG